MPVCAPGVSVLKPGSPTGLVVDAAFAQSLLPAQWSWIYPFIPYHRGLEIGDAATFCSVDPPSILSLPSLDDWYQFISGGPLNQIAIVDTYISSVLRYYLWYRLCTCSTGSTPFPATPPTAPVGLPQPNPPGVVTLPVGGQCDEQFFPGRDTSVLNFSIGGPLRQGRTISAVDLYYEFINPVGPSTATFTPNVEYWYDTATGGTTIIPYTGNFNGNNPGVKHYGPMPAGRDTIAVTLHSTTPFGSSAQFQSRFVYFCDGLTGQVNSMPCCPPDPYLRTSIRSLQQTVELLQRQISPFAYVAGPAHSGLTGQGSIAVQGILGVLLNVSAPSRASVLSGEPDTLYDVGWINFGTASGYESKRMIRSDSQLIFPDVAGLWTLVGYTLLPGVTMTLTELRREF
jgi:hypothetical protein